MKRLGLETTGNKEELKNRLSAAWQDGDEDDVNDAQEVHESEHGRAPLTQNGADDVRQNLKGGQRCGGQSREVSRYQPTGKVHRG